MKVVKVPLNAGSMKERQGLEKGPGAVREAAKDFYLGENGLLPVIETDEVSVDNGNLEEAHKAIYEKVKGLGGFSVLLGGDHSITLPAFKAFAEGKSNPGLVVFDAHLDMMQGFGTHEDYLRSLVDEGLKPENIIVIGVRNTHSQEEDFVKSNKIKVFRMKEFSFEGKEEVADAVTEIASAWSDLYVSFDIDVLDPAFAPGVSYCEPGGMTTRELLYFVHRLKKLKNFKMADIVEVNPDKDNGLTASAAAKVLVELN